MRVRNVDAHFLEDLAEIEGVGKRVRRDKEELAADEVGAFRAVGRERGRDVEELGNLAGENERAEQHAHPDAEPQIMRADHAITVAIITMLDDFG
jgi:hypothetical protein